MFLLIDNYDSFTYNLYHYLLEIGVNVEVYRNDAISLNEIKNKSYKGIIISPGPCTPDEAGICLNVIKNLHEITPIFGVCLGHQSIGQAFGARVIRGEKPMHAKISKIQNLENSLIFKNVPKFFEATRYHSLIVEKNTLPDCLKITATSDDGVIQAMEHIKYPVFGVQFHPESITSEYGHKILENFVNIAKDYK